MPEPPFSYHQPAFFPSLKIYNNLTWCPFSVILLLQPVSHSSEFSLNGCCVVVHCFLFITVGKPLKGFGL